MAAARHTNANGGRDLLLLLLLLVPAGHGLKIVIDIIGKYQTNSPQTGVGLIASLDTLNSYAAQLGLPSNFTSITQRVVFLNATILSANCSAGSFLEENPLGSGAFTCTACNCSSQRWIAPAGRGVGFAPLV